MKPIPEKLKNFLVWQRVPAKAIEFRNINQEISILIGYSLFYIALGYLFSLTIIYHPLPILGTSQFGTDVWYSIVYKFIFLLCVPATIYFFTWEYSCKDLFLGFRPTVKNSISTLSFLVLGLLLNSGYIKAIVENFTNFQDAYWRFILGILLPLISAALPEELFFRGYLQTRLEKKYNRILAITSSSILFAAWHLPSRYLLSTGIEGSAGNFTQILVHTGIPVFLVSLFLGIHWSRCRNIVFIVITHWAIDILPTVNSFFSI